MIYYNMKYIIYKIQIKDYIYIGSTQNFTIRKSRHKQTCNAGKDMLVYNTIRDNGGWDCCTMVPVKEIEVESKIQARILEEELRIEYDAQMNTNRAYQSVEERKEQKKKWADENKDYFTQRERTKERIEYNRQRYLAKKVKKAESPEIKVET